LKKKWLLAAVALMILCVFISGCDKTVDSGDPDYEAMTITVEGLPDGDKEISVEELRQLEQHDLDASYKRTTGLYEEFKMSGPYLADVLEYLGVDISDYDGIGVQGSDNYYCLVSREVIGATPDLMLAVVIDGEAKLGEDKAPAQLAVQGQFGPYWVKMVNKIILYKKVPEKKIASVWVFDNLTDGLEVSELDYYGSKDASIELEDVFTRFDNVDSKSFFSMKSSDGFQKNEALNMVKARYYIKTEGKDAPTNISPYIKLGMNVQKIAWFSTNADAVFFPEQLETYLDKVAIGGYTGIKLSEILYETEVEKIEGLNFEVIGMDGERVKATGEQLSKGILVINDDGTYSVIWDSATGLAKVKNLLRIHLIEDAAATAAASSSASGSDANQNGNTQSSGSADHTDTADYSKKTADTVLTISGNGVSQTSYFTLADLKAMKSGYQQNVYSIVNNWPTRKFFVAKGVTLDCLLKAAGLKSSATLFKVSGSDGYYSTLTRTQLLGSRYYYPNVTSGSTAGGESVKAIMAWSWKEGSSDLSAAKAGDLRLAIGQIGVDIVNTTAIVQKASSIEVSTAAPGSWSAPTVSPAPGKVAAGSGITLNYSNLDAVRIFYTTDGSTPTYNSKLYNPSTTYYQPDLIKPIEINKTTTIKCLVTGFGKNDSSISTFTYTVE